MTNSFLISPWIYLGIFPLIYFINAMINNIAFKIKDTYYDSLSDSNFFRLLKVPLIIITLIILCLLFFLYINTIIGLYDLLLLGLIVLILFSIYFLLVFGYK